MAIDTGTRGQAGADGMPPGGATAAEDTSRSSQLWSELHKAQQLAGLVSEWGGSLIGLARLELQLAVQSAPKILGLALALVPLLKLAWLSFCLLAGWLAYQASGNVAVGLATLLGLQLIVMALFLWQIKRLKAKSTFPETREQWQLFLQELKSRPEASSEDFPANHH